MSMTLKPCPFCGGEASVEYDASAGTAARGYRVRCGSGSCNGEVECGTHAFGTEAEAMAAWNRRAGRTCRMVDNGAELCCSECDRRHSYDDEPEFCMGCGARVVGYM